MLSMTNATGRRRPIHLHGHAFGVIVRQKQEHHAAGMGIIRVA